MIFDMLMLLIIISIIIFVFIIMLDTEWKLCIPLIMVNMIFIILITYGFWDVEWFYIEQSSTPVIYSTADYSVYSYIFVAFFFIHVLLFFKAGYDAWMDALNTKGQMKYTR